MEKKNNSEDNSNLPVAEANEDENNLERELERETPELNLDDVGTNQPDIACSSSEIESQSLASCSGIDSETGEVLKETIEKSCLLAERSDLIDTSESSDGASSKETDVSQSQPGTSSSSTAGLENFSEVPSSISPSEEDFEEKDVSIDEIVVRNPMRIPLSADGPTITEISDSTFSEDLMSLDQTIPPENAIPLYGVSVLEESSSSSEMSQSIFNLSLAVGSCEDVIITEVSATCSATGIAESDKVPTIELPKEEDRSKSTRGSLKRALIVNPDSVEKIADIEDAKRKKSSD